MTEGLKRYYGQRHLHFITFSCYGRLPLLASTCAKNAFVQILADVREQYGFSLVGYVVMPEHVHLLMSEPKSDSPSTVLQVLKQRTSRRLRSKSISRTSASEIPLRSDETHAPLRGFWQKRFYDFNVWSAKKKVEKLLYMHLNPVKRGLVAHPKDWLWSSYAFYNRHSPGLVAIDRVD